MFFNLIRECKIAGVDYSKHFVDAHIVSDRSATGDTAQINLAKTKNISSDMFKTGDEISLRVGYSRYGLADEFAGVIVEAGPQTNTIELQCEDFFYEVRQRTLSRQFKNMSLDRIVAEASGKEVIKQADHTYPVVTVGAWAKITARAFIAQLTQKHGYIAAFEGKKIRLTKKNYCPYETYPGYFAGINIIENNLMYHQSENIQCVHVVSENEHGYLVKSFFGKNGKNPSRTFHLDGVSASDARNRAKELFEELNFDGLKGHFTTIGFPYLKHSMVISIFPDGFGGKKYDQIVDKVETIISSSDGFSRTIFPAKIIPEPAARPAAKKIDKNPKTAKVTKSKNDWEFWKNYVNGGVR